MIINPVTVTMNRSHLELLLELAQKKLAGLTPGSATHDRLENAVFSLDDALVAAARKRQGQAITTGESR